MGYLENVALLRTSANTTTLTEVYKVPVMFFFFFWESLNNCRLKMHVGWEIAHETIFHSVYYSILQGLVKGLFWSLHKFIHRLMSSPKTQRDYFYSTWKVRSTKSDRQALLISGGLLHRKVQTLAVLIPYTNSFLPEQWQVLLIQDTLCNWLNFCIHLWDSYLHFSKNAD